MPSFSFFILILEVFLLLPPSENLPQIPESVVEEQTGRHLPLPLFFKIPLNDRAKSPHQSSRSPNKPNGGCWQRIDSLLMEESLTV